MVVKGGVGAHVFIRFLKCLIHGQRCPVFLIVDGHPAHRARIVSNYVAALGGRLRLYFLLPYLPELNPDERVWNDMKNNAVGRSCHDGLQDLHRAVVGRLRSLQKRPRPRPKFLRRDERRRTLGGGGCQA